MAYLADIALIGLAVMGENLARNLADHGFQVAVYNRNPDRLAPFLKPTPTNNPFLPCASLAELASKLARPRKIILMVKAGPAVDELITQLRPLLAPGDILIDGGNSHYKDTARRVQELTSHGLLYVGAGISGGEFGARHGPAIMPGGNKNAWPAIKDILQKIAAHTPDGQPCCNWVGPEGSGHYVKMVHNGIEYALMQAISEIYHLMKARLLLDNPAISKKFAAWNKTDLASYLLEITATICAKREADGSFLVDHILDVAEQKGTGHWTIEAASAYNRPATVLAAAVFARSLSQCGEERRRAAATIGKEASIETAIHGIEKRLPSALYLASFIIHAQGFDLLQAASQAHNWDLDCGTIAGTWRAGCIIRSQLMEKIHQFYSTATTNQPNNLLLEESRIVKKNQGDLRTLVKGAIAAHIPVPVLSTSLDYIDSLAAPWLPANLIQAQRDYFGAHLYERTDAPRGEFFHTNWEAEC